MHFRPPEEQNDHKVTCGVATAALPRVLGGIEATLAAAGVDVNIITSGTGAGGLRGQGRWGGPTGRGDGVAGRLRGGGGGGSGRARPPAHAAPAPALPAAPYLPPRRLAVP
jgi:hypothetical protein